MARGQSVVIVAFGLVVVLLFAALAIDGSNAYQQRRRMQNAADAAALAGARLLAKGNTTNGDILSTITTYATRNGAAADGVAAFYVDNDSLIGDISSYGASSSPPAEAVGVQVYCETTFTQFLGGIIGIGQKKASAEAVAKFGAMGSLSSGGFPVGVNDDLLTSITAGMRIKIWDSNKITDDSGAIIANGERGWLNFNYVYNINDPNGRTISTSHSNADLREWVRNGYSQPLYAGSVGGMDGDFIAGDPGTRSSTIQEAADKIGQIVVIPIYDNFYDDSVVEDYVEENGYTEPNVHWPNGNMYHVVGFAAFRITNAVHTGSDKYIEGEFVSRIGAGGLAGAGGFISDESMKVVTLAEVNTPVGGGYASSSSSSTSSSSGSTGSSSSGSSTSSSSSGGSSSSSGSSSASSGSSSSSSGSSSGHASSSSSSGASSGKASSGH